MIGSATAVRSHRGEARPPRTWLLFLAAVVLMSPELVWGISWTDSLPYNIVWTEQFRSLVREGDLYPRWLPSSWDGLGSPTFYIYPPLYFWVASALDLLTLGLLPVEKLVPVTSLAFLAGAGWAMKAWLSEQVGGRAPVLGALAYMAAPHHLYDIYFRGALAEAASYAMVPLILLGLIRLARGKRGSILLTAPSYAALILTHLPTALILSFFVLPWFVLHEAARARSGRAAMVAKAGLCACLGAGLAAFYVLPALLLGSFISYEALFASFYQPGNWLVWYPERWPRTYPIAWTLLVCSAAAPLIAYAGVKGWRSGRSDVLFWSIAVLVGIIMALGLVPMLWSLPLIERVQFPFRFLIIVEFALITALVLAMPRLRNPVVLAGATLWAVAIAVIASIVVRTAPPSENAKLARLKEIRADWRDAPEYLPPSMPIVFGNEARVPERRAIGLPDLPPVSLNPALGTASERRNADGSGQIVVSTPAPAVVTLRRFYFPHWRVADENGRSVRVEAAETGLVQWRAPAGQKTYYLAQGPVPGENLGLALSAMSLALLLFAAFLLDRRAQILQSQS